MREYDETTLKVAERVLKRSEEIVRIDYNAENPYGPTHPDAISDGDPQGKGTGHGGHNAWLPDCTKPNNMIDYSNFDTTNGGGEYDIKGRNDIGGRERSLARSMYNQENQYNAGLVNTEQNVAECQYYIGQTIKHM